MREKGPKDIKTHTHTHTHTKRDRKKLTQMQTNLQKVKYSFLSKRKIEDEYDYFL